MFSGTNPSGVLGFSDLRANGRSPCSPKAHMLSYLFKQAPLTWPRFRLVLAIVSLPVSVFSTNSASALELKARHFESWREIQPSEESSNNLLMFPGESSNTNPTWNLLSGGGSNGLTLGAAQSSSNEIRLRGYQQSVIASAPGSTVTLDLQNIVLSGHSTLTLLGDATATFVLNVTNQFSLAQSAKIVLSGGLQWNQVFFNVLGTGNVSIAGKSALFGTLTAPQRTVRLAGHALVYGTISAQRVIFRQAAQVITPPIVSH